MGSGEVLLRGGEVVDGTGAARFRADVLVAGGRIQRIGTLDPAEHPAAHPGARVVDVRGLVTAPGFIDLHAHSDLALLRDPVHLVKVAQGVTTEVIGQDGLGYAPVDDASLAQIAATIAPWNGPLDPSEATWRTVGEFLDRLDSGIPTNAVVLVPQGNLRMLAVGHENRPATAPELADMRAILRDGLDAGARGMSSGLTYAPGMYADTAELVALAEVVAARGGFWSPHTRGYGRGALAAFAEALDVGRRSGCAVHLTHATMNFPSNRGRADEFLRLVDDALEEGLDVTLDSYPYLAGATTLAGLLPGWAHEGGPTATLERLRDPRERERMRVALEETGSDGAHGETVDWSSIQVSGVARVDPGIVGLTVAELAARTGSAPTTVALDLMLEEGLGTGILMHIGDEENVRAIMRHPAHGGGSDGILVGERPHPRGWGTFPRYLGHYARELGVLTLEETVRHLAGTPARRLGLEDRGVVREGAVADLVVFDPRSVRDEATYQDPRRSPTGIHHALVAGEPTLLHGRRTNALPGRTLRA